MSLVIIHRESLVSTTCKKILLFAHHLISIQMRIYENRVGKNIRFVWKIISSGSSAIPWLISSQLRISLRIQQQGLCSVTDDHTATKRKTGIQSSGKINEKHFFCAMKSGRSKSYQIKAGALIAMQKTNGERDMAVICRENDKDNL